MAILNITFNRNMAIIFTQNMIIIISLEILILQRKIIL